MPTDERVPPVVLARAWIHVIAAGILANECAKGDPVAANQFFFEALELAKHKWLTMPKSRQEEELGVVSAWFVDGINPHAQPIDVKPNEETPDDH